MTATLYFSNRIENLADRLADNLRLSTKIVDPFTPIPIIVPNANLAKWLQLALCRRRSVVFNLQFIYLEEGLARMVSSANRLPEAVDAFSAPLLDVDQRALQVLFALKNMALDQPALTPIYAYLFDQNGVKRPDYPLRIWQLSQRMARLFQEYEYHREELIDHWLRGKPHAETDLVESALCQRTIYRWIQQRRDAISTDSAFRDSFFEFVLKASGDLEIEGVKRIDRPWHFFGLSHLSRFHLRLMDRMQPHFIMRLYTLNPCREFWEDIPSAAELRTRMKAGQDTSAIVVEHELVSAWGRPGRETMALLCRLTNYEIEEEFYEHLPETVLGRLQRSFLTLTSPESQDRLCQDQSLQIAACPGRRREVETVYNAILQNLAQNDDLQLTDIAVLVPDMAKYLPYVELVFNGFVRKIAYNLVDSGAGEQSHYGQAVLDLFVLVETQLGRKAVFAFLQNPCVMQRFKISQAELTHWADWVMTLGIFRSPHTPSKSKSPRQWATRLFSWQQGLLRLRLGRIFTTIDHEGSINVDHFQSLEPYNDIQSSDPDAVEHFCQVMETLFGVCDRLQQPVRQAEDWSKRMQWACRETLSIPTLLADEGVVQQKLFEALADLTQYDQMRLTDLKKTATPFGFDEIKNYLKVTLANFRGGRGDYLTSGVTIAELAPMRPIPFKVIFVLGLEAGSFPGRSDVSTLDLRRVKRQIGDVTLPERQRYLFLEVLLSVREKLYLTYVSQDLDKDRELTPGSVLVQLLNYLEKNLLPPGDRFDVQQIPLNGFSGQYLSSADENRIGDLLSSQNPFDRVAAYGFYDLWPQVREKQKEKHPLASLGYDRLWQNPTERLSQTEIALQTQNHDDRLSDFPETIALDELRWFLLDPVEQISKKRLGTVGRESLRMLHSESDEEPLFAEFPFVWQIVSTVLNQVVETSFFNPGKTTRPSDVATILDQVYARYARQNRVPLEPFAATDKSALLEIIHATGVNGQKLLAHASGASVKHRRFVLGDGPHYTDDTIDPMNSIVGSPALFAFQADSGIHLVTIALNGSQDFVWQDQHQCWHILVPAAIKYKPPKFPKQLMNAALFYFAAKAGNVPLFENAQGVNLYLAANNGLFGSQLTLNAKEVKAYLQHLIVEYVCSSQPLWLPWQTVQALPTGPFRGVSKTVDVTSRQSFKRALTDQFDRTRPEKIGLLQTQITDDVLDQAIQRFAVFPKLKEIKTDDL